jgi:UDP-N-acetylglucosamine acyltransferase
MAYAHVAHDCHIGDRVILANAVNMGGHVTIEDWAIVGGMTPIHQFVRIGEHAFVGGASRVPKDVAPYVRCCGQPAGDVGAEQRRAATARVLAEVPGGAEAGVPLFFMSS